LKKLAIAALVALSFAATAADFNGFVSTDYTRSTGNAWDSNYETHIGLGYDTKYGIVDGAFVYNQNIGANDYSNGSKGVELGYSYSTVLPKDYYGLKLTGRTAWGQVAYNDYYVLQGEAKYKFDPTVATYVDYRFRNGFDDAVPSQNRYGFGADVTLMKDVVARVGYNYTRAQGLGYNGISGAINVGF